MGIAEFLNGLKAAAAEGRSASSGLSCLATGCKYNPDGRRCTLPAAAIKIDQNWECTNFRRG